MTNKLSIIAISDLHGHLPEITEKSEVMFIAGDISPLYIQRNIVEMKIWLETLFLKWVNTLPVEKVFLIGGNHDFYFEGMNETQKYEFQKMFGGKLVYLENELTTYVDLNSCSWSIFGTPYCHIFGRWPFMIPDENMEIKFSEIPAEVDVIISHDPPYGVGEVDVILERKRWSNEEIEHIGNIPLRNRLEQIKFNFLCAGHIHSGNHEVIEFNGGKCVNVSIKDENYDPTYKPFYHQLEK